MAIRTNEEEAARREQNSSRVIPMPAGLPLRRSQTKGFRYTGHSEKKFACSVIELAHLRHPKGGEVLELPRGGQAVEKLPVIASGPRFG